MTDNNEIKSLAEIYMLLGKLLTEEDIKKIKDYITVAKNSNSPSKAYQIAIKDYGKERIARIIRWIKIITRDYKFLETKNAWESIENAKNSKDLYDSFMLEKNNSWALAVQWLYKKKEQTEFNFIKKIFK